MRRTLALALTALLTALNAPGRVAAQTPNTLPSYLPSRPEGSASVPTHPVTHATTFVAPAAGGVIACSNSVPSNGGNMCATCKSNAGVTCATCKSAGPRRCRGFLAGLGEWLTYRPLPAPRECNVRRTGATCVPPLYSYFALRYQGPGHDGHEPLAGPSPGPHVQPH